MVNADIRSAEVLKRLSGIECPSVAEIGVFEGEMSRRLLYRLNLQLLMVDAWGTFESDSYKASGDDKATMDSETWKRVKNKAIRNTEWANERVRMYQGTSLDAATFFNDSFDLVFLDAAHDYQNVSDDIEAWWPKVSEGGYLGGHDYRNDLNYGVIDAVNDFAEENGLTVELGGNTTWFIRK
jgi:hypothetical protein